MWSSDLDDWGPVEKKPVEKPKETINGSEPAGVEACPKCGAFILPDAKCESCGWNPKATDCKQCGNRYDGTACNECGWNPNVPQCRNCAAYLTDNHIVLKSLNDGWVWKTCAYCRWPIEKYLDTGLGQIERYVKPYESHYSDYGGGFGFGGYIATVLAIFMIVAFVPVLSTLTSGPSGFTPSANVTSASAVNGTMTVASGINAISQSLGGGGPFIWLFPMLMFAVFVAVAVKIFRGVAY